MNIVLFSGVRKINLHVIKHAVTAVKNTCSKAYANINNSVFRAEFECCTVNMVGY